MLKEKIYRFVSEEIRNKILSEGSFLLKGLGLFFLERKPAREIAGEDGEILTLPPENIVSFEHRPEKEDGFYIDHQAYQYSGDNQPDLPFTKDILLKLFASVKELKDGEYVSADGLGHFVRVAGVVDFYPDDSLAREVNFEFAGQLAVRLKSGQRSYFIPKSASLQDKLSSLSNVTGREPELLYEKEESLTETVDEGPASDTESNKEQSVSASESDQEEAAPGRNENQAAAEKKEDESENEQQPKESVEDVVEAVSDSDTPEEESVPKDDSAARLEIVLKEGRIRKYEREKPNRPLSVFDKVAAIISVTVLLVIVIYLLNIYGLISFGENKRTIITSPYSDPVTLATEEARERETETSQPEGDTQAQQTSGSGSEELSEAAEQDLAQEEIPPATGSSEADEAATIIPEPQPQPEIRQTVSEPDFGLMGEMETFSVRPFGIVLHSLANEALARTEMEAFIEAGYRATIYPTTRADGVVSWRVSIGQFRTVEDATRAALTLDEPWRSNNFISRLP